MKRTEKLKKQMLLMTRMRFVDTIRSVIVDIQELTNNYLSFRLAKDVPATVAKNGKKTGE